MFNFYKSGFSIVEFAADNLGNVINPKIVKSSGKLFDEKALQNLKKFKLPYQVTNHSSELRYRLPMYFKRKYKV